MRVQVHTTTTNMQLLYHQQSLSHAKEYDAILIVHLELDGTDLLVIIQQMSKVLSILLHCTMWARAFNWIMFSELQHKSVYTLHNAHAYMHIHMQMQCIDSTTIR